MATIKLKTTTGELVDLMNGLFNSQDIKGKEFALAVSKNISILQEHLDHVEQAGRPSQEFVKFAQEIRMAQDAKDDESVKELESKNAELIAERKLQIEKVQGLLKEESKEVELHVITQNQIPHDVTARQMNNLEKIIE